MNRHQKSFCWRRKREANVQAYCDLFVEFIDMLDFDDKLQVSLSFLQVSKVHDIGSPQNEKSEELIEQMKEQVSVFTMVLDPFHM